MSLAKSSAEEVLSSGEMTTTTTRVSSVLRRCRRMVLATLLISALSLWILGTLITVQIDSEREREGAEEELLLRSERMDNLSHHVDTYCQRKERQRLLHLDVWKLLRKGKAVAEDQEEEEEEENRRALREEILRNSLVYVKDLNQMWCLVPKAASTSWSKVLLDYLNYKNLQQPHRLLFSVILPTAAPDTTKTPLQVILKSKYKNIDSTVYENAARDESVKKVLLVRHPFARLVSAYEDKLKDRLAKTDSMYFFRSYGVKINRQYRVKSGSKSVKRKEPTFAEFIEYLIQTDPLKYDEHWQPISVMCGMCNVKYDHIIRQEDLEASSSFHLRKLGFPSDFIVSHQNPSIQSSSSMGSETHHHHTPFNFTTYFSSIPRRKMLKLFKIYQDDFQLFNYNFFDYYIAGN